MRPGIAALAGWVAFAALVAHLGILPGGAGPVWNHASINYDDPQVLRHAQDRSVPEIVTGTTYFAYKPVYFLSLKLDVAIFGDAVAGGALVENLLLHALAAFLLVVLLAQVLGSPWIAGAAGLLFAVHPAHVESVAWIAERKGVLSLVLVLSAHLAYRRGRDKGSGDARPRPAPPAGGARRRGRSGPTRGSSRSTRPWRPRDGRAPSSGSSPSSSWRSAASPSTRGWAPRRAPAPSTTGSRRPRSPRPWRRCTLLPAPRDPPRRALPRLCGRPRGLVGEPGLDRGPLARGGRRGPDSSAASVEGTRSSRRPPGSGSSGSRP